MRHTKYVTSGGLAFSEGKDMEKLRRYSKEGWHVRDFKFMGYTLEKGEITDYIYSVDYRLLKQEEAEEYFELFSSSGWTHISSQGDIHLFRALPGTKPIYSDSESVVEKHDNLGSSMRWGTVGLVFVTAILWIAALISAGTLQMTFTIMAVILSIPAIPAAWTVMTIYSNKWNAEGRQGLARLIKSLPILFLILVTLIILYVVDDLNQSVRLLAYMLIGAVALPTAVWAIMSVYQKSDRG
ncbi:DUF2812 domain-containing protein [Neobacillus niacini]|uniref:DUF2812 domain-containing protein n=1 Tax=Neobacillus niacini TaxID=86668 RepID=UPI003983BE48